jgi:peroxiredoxin
LADYQKALPELEKEEIGLVAASVDPFDKAMEVVKESGLSYPLAYELDAESVSTATGAYYQKEKGFLHATGFLLRPGNDIEIACYSSGALGRLHPRNIVTIVQAYKKK